jgi:alpha-1,2-mannosyltransferase
MTELVWDRTGALWWEWLVRLVTVGLFGLLPAVQLVQALFHPGLGWDFHAFYDAGRHYLVGASPYGSQSLAAVSSKQEFVYPAAVAAVFAPFALLPYAVALALWLVASSAAVVVALWLLGVRDWRCYGALFLTSPLQEGIRLGTLMPFLTLLLALLWRYRDQVVAAAGLAAAVALSKLFLLPLLVWLAVTRRVKTVLLAAGLVAAILLLGWLPIGLGTISSYPGLLDALSAFEQTFSYSLTSFALALALSGSAATAIAVGVCASLLLGAATAGRRDDFLAFRLALAASFALSPIVWGHYYVLLAVALAVRWPRLSPVWLAAIWIKNDTLVLPQPELWVGLALLVLAIQLDLLAPLRRKLHEQASYWTSAAIGTTLVASALIASKMATQPGQVLSAPLYAITADYPASGTALVRVDASHRDLCWRVWTQALQPGPATIVLRQSTGVASLTTKTKLHRNGQATSCASLAPAQGTLVDELADQPHRYTIAFSVTGAGSIAGAFKTPPRGIRQPW